MIAENPDIEGNLTIYFLFLISNICLLVLGIITIFISIYLIAITSSLSFINVTLFLFGIFFIVIAIYGFKLRSSIEGNLVYSIILSVTFVLDLVLTILLIEFKNLVVSWVIDKIQDSTQSIDELKKIMNRNFTEVNNLLIVILLIFVRFLIKIVFNCCILLVIQKIFD